MSSFWADVFAHAAFFIGFLPMFYFTYVVPVQGNALVNDFFGLLKDELTDLSLTLSPNIKREIDEEIENAVASEESNPVLASMTRGNAGVFKNTMIFLGVTLPVLLITAIVLQYRAGGSLFDLFLGNLIVITFIAVSEFAIVGIFVGNFVEVDKDFVKAEVVHQTYTNYEQTVFNGDCNFVYQFAVSKFGSKLADMFLDSPLHISAPYKSMLGPDGTRQMFGPGGTQQLYGKTTKRKV